MRFRYVAALLGTLMMLAGCAGEPQQVEVTRVVSEQVPVTVEVTRLIAEAATVEVPVEVTRIVEVVVTATPAADEATETPVLTETPVAPAADSGGVYVVQAGESLAFISGQTGVDTATIMAANNLTPGSVITVGQELVIPGWNGSGETAAIPTAAATAASTTAAPAPATAAPTTAAPATTAPPAPVAQGGNLLPNPSFEGDWYFSNYNELQVPEGWLLTTDEGANTLEPGAGGLFNRPEVRVLTTADLPPAEQGLFVFEGNKTVKAFKGAAPTSFALFTDVNLQPGRYRMQISFFPDAVEGQTGAQKTFSPDPLAAEVRIIQDGGGTVWQGTQIGQRNTVTHDFTVTQAGPVRVGAAFRNRYILSNNGWFLDDWSLTALE